MVLKITLINTTLATIIIISPAIWSQTDEFLGIVSKVKKKKKKKTEK